MRSLIHSRISAFILCAALVSAPATAQGDTELQTLLDEAQRSYDLGKFEDAAEAYSRAYEKKQLPGVLFNLGQCHRQLGNWDRALFFYNRYLDHSPDGKNAPMARELVRRVRERPLENPALLPKPIPEPPGAATAVDVASAPEPAATSRAWWIVAGAGALAVAGAVVLVAAMPRERTPTLGTADLR